MSAVAQALGKLRRNDSPVAKQGVLRNRRRGPVPRQIVVKPGVRQKCYVCKENKLLREYSSDRTRPNGVMSRCKACNNERVKAYNESPKGRARHRRYRLQKDYGLTEETYSAIVRAQDGVCALCKRHPKYGPRGQFYIDHDHETKKVRGLLCGTCNSGLGLFKENPVTLRAAADYLERHA